MSTNEDVNFSSFDKLIKEVKKCPPSKVLSYIPKWKVGIEKTWQNESYQWRILVQLLPLQSNKPESVKTFNKIETKFTEPPNAPLLVFLTLIGSQGKFQARYLYDQLSPKAIQLCAGCINLLGLAKKSRNKFIKETFPTLQKEVTETLEDYPLALIAIHFYHPTILKLSEDNMLICDSLDAPLKIRQNSIFDNWGERGKYARSSLSEILNNAGDELDAALDLICRALSIDMRRALRLMYFALHEELELPFDKILTRYFNRMEDFVNIPEQVLSEYNDLIKEALTSDKFHFEHDRQNILHHFRIATPQISSQFRNICSKIERTADEKHKEIFSLWASYLVPDDEFAYGWLFFRAKSSNNNDCLFGSDLDGRLREFESYLMSSLHDKEIRLFRMKGKDEFEKNYNRLRGWIEFFRAFESLLDLKSRTWRGEPDFNEACVRQTAALQALRSCPETMPVSIRGMVQMAEEHWDRVDPIILGLPKDTVVKTLTYMLDDKVVTSHSKIFHTQLLLKHAGSGIDAPESSVSGGRLSLLGAVENLIEVSRSRVPQDRSQTWFGDIGVESIWRGAVEAACTEFFRTYDKWGGHDEHEPVFSLASTICRYLEDSNSIVQKWLSDRHIPNLSIELSVKRFPKKGKADSVGEGGKGGTRADLGLIFNCDVPRLAKAKRATLLQVKSLWTKDVLLPNRGSVSVDRIQLKELLNISDHAHYMFLFRSELSSTPLVVPAKFVNDILSAQRGATMPVSILLRAAKDLPTFLVHDIIGLWTGDTDSVLIDKTGSGSVQGVAPWVAIEIQVFERNKENE